MRAGGDFGAARLLSVDARKLRALLARGVGRGSIVGLLLILVVSLSLLNGDLPFGIGSGGGDRRSGPPPDCG